MQLTLSTMDALISEMADANLMPYRRGKAEVWLDALADLPAPTVDAAVWHMIRTHRSGGPMPTPGDIRAHITNQPDREEGDE